MRTRPPRVLPHPHLIWLFSIFYWRWRLSVSYALILPEFLRQSNDKFYINYEFLKLRDLINLRSPIYHLAEQDPDFIRFKNQMNEKPTSFKCYCCTKLCRLGPQSLLNPWDFPQSSVFYYFLCKFLVCFLRFERIC